MTATPVSIELADAPAQNTGNLLAQFAFGQPDSAQVIAHPGLRPLAGAPVYEIWRTPEATTQGQARGLRWRASEQLLLGSTSVSLGGDGAEASRQLYQKILARCAQGDYPYLLRLWNFMPHINQGDGDREVYKQFCAGRASVFDEHAKECWQVPAATAIGRRGEDAGNELVVHFLAAREPGQRVENPRQTSAPDYPRQYGPRSPQFARATAWPGQDAGAGVLLVSGTASIVGHESQHIDDLGRQLEETWANLEQLRASAQARDALSLRVYIRHETDYPQVREFIRARVPDELPVLYLHADICRAELLLEIEAVYAMAAPAP